MVAHRYDDESIALLDSSHESLVLELSATVDDAQAEGLRQVRKGLFAVPGVFGLVQDAVVILLLVEIADAAAMQVDP